MRFICLWCAILVGMAKAEEEYYAPQTFGQLANQDSMFQPSSIPWSSPLRKSETPVTYTKPLFAPTNDVQPQGTSVPWRPNPPPPVYDNYNRGDEGSKPDWRVPYALTKEQKASILHHKQSLSSEGAFRFEYASDNGLAAGEVIEPDGSRIGAYQYKDPSGQTVKLKYRAGKEGFQILEGSHLPKSPEPVAPTAQDNYYQQAYEQQRQQYQLQQQYNSQRAEPRPQWQENQGSSASRPQVAPQFVNPGPNQNWRPEGTDDGQYRDNYLEEQNRGPHSFGEGYAFAFKG